MSYAPCKNPNCKSFGKPHPNCRCYGEFAEGGEVAACSGPHKRECEYFAEGGAPSAPGAGEIPAGPRSGEEVPADLLPEGSVSDAPNPGPGAGEMPEPEPKAGEEVPEDMIPPESGAEVPADMVPEPGSLSMPSSIGDAVSRIGKSGIFKTPESDTPTEPGEKWDTPENVKAMDKRFEDAAAVGSVITGGGVVKGANAAAAKVADLVGLGKVGSAALKGAISNGLIEATDETSKWMMGENPEHPVGAILAAAGLGGLIGGGGAAATQKLKDVAEKNLSKKASSWIAGFGAAAQGTERPVEDGIDKSAFSQGEKYFRNLMHIGTGTATSAGAYEGWKEGGAGGAAAGAAKGFAIAKGLGIAKKVATPVILKILSSGTTEGMMEALEHAENVVTGSSRVETAIDGLFDRAAKAGGKAIDTLQSDKKRAEIEDYLENGGVGQDVKDAMMPDAASNFAEGGEVEPLHSEKQNGIATHFPAQNMLMNAAKARASNYLNSLRPAKIHPKLAFDEAPDTRQQEKTYKKAIGVAAAPLSILGKIGDGTIEPEHIKHLNAMYPEVTGLIQKKLTDKIVDAQLKGEKPSYKVRQGLSMLLGTPLSGEMKPENIQAAQAVFAQNKSRQPQEAPAQSKKSTSSLSSSDKQFLTSDQARQERQQRAR